MTKCKGEGVRRRRGGRISIPRNEGFVTLRSQLLRSSRYLLPTFEEKSDVPGEEF